MNTNKKQKNPSVGIVIFGLILFAIAHTINENKYAAICGRSGEMKLDALRMQRSTAELTGIPMPDEDQKELDFIGTERRYGCN
jgi:hypothetical protein